LPKTTRSI